MDTAVTIPVERACLLDNPDEFLSSVGSFRDERIVTKAGRDLGVKDFNKWVNAETDELEKAIVTETKMKVNEIAFILKSSFVRCVFFVLIFLTFSLDGPLDVSVSSAFRLSNAKPELQMGNQSYT